MLVNLHTHKDLDEGVVGIINVENLNAKFTPNHLYSVGVHPWNTLDETWIYNMDRVSVLANNQSVVAIGECGFDNLKGDTKAQDILFTKHVELSEKLQKPLIIHSVGTHHKVLEFQKRLNPTQKWLMHSVMASDELGRQFIKANIYCSFSFRSLQNERSIKLFKSYPRYLIFLETDDSTISIDKIYTFAATILKCDVESLKEQLYSNFRTFIGDGKLAGENPDHGGGGEFRAT